jgi:predicted glycogen debranching enzyme
MSVADRAAAPPIIIPGEICRDFEHSSRLEWLETNHTGAYAMGTAAGVNTRRYHALLLASLHPPADRYSLLSRVEERITVDGNAFELATVQYPGVVQPHGFDLLEEFRLDPFPIWRYHAGGVVIEKTLCLLDCQQSVLLRYTASRPCRLEARVLLAFRDYHSLAHHNTAVRMAATEHSGAVTFTPYPDLPPLTFLHSGKFQGHGGWYLNHEYLREFERGLDFREDLFSPGSLVFDLRPERSAWFIATIEPGRLASPIDAAAVEGMLRVEAKRRRFERGNSFEARLCDALDQFRVRRFDGRSSLVAGYPWFSDWSRDALIGLPALLEMSFPAREAKDILQMLVENRSQGLLPNRFLDQKSKPEYNSADAALWFFIAADDLINRTKDHAFLQSILFPAAEDILAWHFRGTLGGVRVDPADHLLAAGSADTQLTWMDARVAGRPVTPRNGKAVELNALWYNALRIAARWAEMLSQNDRRDAYESAARDTLASFRQKFWNAARGCLYDVLGPDKPDPRIRPNQLFALSLPFPLLEREQARSVMRVGREKLLTPMGIRTLDPADPSYCPRFEGTPPQRDAAYHQGTVWPWLVGPFVNAYLYAYGESEESVRFCRQIVSRFEEQLVVCCLGSLAEVYDGETPQRPGGCPAQLWSVAQVALAWKRVNETTG